jgi:2-amino-4-hydroxy-6-hydroxymethyldihydropteridine diphosphokinase
MVVTFLAIGSNQGNRKGYLKNAVRALEDHGIRILRIASIYETEPKELRTQPWFLNSVVAGHTDHTVHRLLEICLAIERENHRVRDQSNGPRTLDIDIIFYGDHVIREPDLTIPHPRFSERNFVLVPLAEIAPDFVDPQTGQTIADLLKKSADSAEVRLAGSLHDSS